MLSEFLITALHQADAQDAPPLHRLLYEALRRAILGGQIAPGARLPSSRKLAQELSVSRNTVLAAIGQLGVEGYLVSHAGSGTFVSDSLVKVNAARRQATQTPSVHCAELSHRGRALTERFCASALEVQPFTPGVADFSAFPVQLWQRLQNKYWRLTYPDMLDYSKTGGYMPLRRAVANHLRMFRSVTLDTSQVLITTGTQQSLELCAHLLADHGDTVWLEDPAYWGAVKAFTATGLKLHPIAVDEEGIAPGPADAGQPPRLVYLTPSHQYPTGAVMSLARRHLLLAQARAHDAWILEDDYDSEFRFAGPPLSSLQGLDQDDRVLYMGTFSKVMYPGLKIGYLVVPKPITAAFQQAHYDLNRPGQMHTQAALAEFIEEGHFASTLRRARHSHAQRRQGLLEALAPCLQARHATISGAEQGLHLCLNLSPLVDDAALARALGRHGITVRPLSAYCLARRDIRGLVIGYGYTVQAEIAASGRLIAELVSQFTVAALAKLADKPRAVPAELQAELQAAIQATHLPAL